VLWRWIRILVHSLASVSKKGLNLSFNSYILESDKFVESLANSDVSKLLETSEDNDEGLHLKEYVFLPNCIDDEQQCYVCVTGSAFLCEYEDNYSK
jgi:hypothetical protein